MSERYSKLFVLKQNLYAESSPVIIAAGALLKDNQSGKVLAQLKLRSISDKMIKAVTVSIVPLDTVGKPLGNPISHQYLDLNAQRDNDFAQKSPVALPNTSTRAFTVSVDEVIFADNSVWKSSGKAWKSIESPKHLDELGDAELIKQFKLKYGAESKNMLSEQKDIWFCTCGSMNHSSETECRRCGNKLDELRKLDMAELETAKTERLEKEAADKKVKAAKTKKLSIIFGSIAAVALIAVLLITQVFMPAAEQREREARAEAKQRELLAAYEEAETFLENGEAAKAAISFYKLGDYADARERSFEIWSHVSQRETLISVSVSTIGLKADGTVVATGKNDYGQCKVGSWENVVAIYCGGNHTVGLKADGTVVATGKNDYGQCDVNDWSDIVAISCSDYHTVGLKSDGTVVATGKTNDTQCNVGNWKNIIAIYCEDYHTVGLKADGTVVATGYRANGQCKVSDWSDIIAISCSNVHTVGLKADGTVVATGDNDYGRCDVNDWSDIVAISCCDYHTVGLKADGTVVATGENDYGQCDVNDWSDIVAITCGGHHTVGLKADGTVVATGSNRSGQCNVDRWIDIKVPTRIK